MNNSNNPFKQSAATWEITIDGKYKYIDPLSDILGQFADASSYFEKTKSASVEIQPDDEWTLKLYFENPPEVELLENMLAAFNLENGTNLFLQESVYVTDKDWVSEVQKNFKPINSGEFYIYNSFNKDEKSDKKYKIQIDPGRAFGTGEHETTKGCLELISRIPAGSLRNSIIDIGTGSLILALACALKFDQKILATDLDEQAIEVSLQNAEINGLADKIEIFQADGPFHERIKANAPYDLIIANILFDPLVKMSSGFAEIISDNGKLILSGFLDTQVDRLVAKFAELGFKEQDRYESEHWVAVCLAK
jgi:ribosomal protein L11 methyltransferase